MPGGQLVDPAARGLPVELDRAAVEQARLVRGVRARLLAQGSVTYQMLAEGRGTTEGAARKWASRRVDALISVVHDGTVFVPTFQLDEAFDLRANVGEVTVRLRRYGFDDWAAWDWWTTANGWLDSASPLEAADRGQWQAVDRAVRRLVQE